MPETGPPAGSDLYSVEVAHELSPTNWFRRWLQPLVSTIEIGGNVTYRGDDPAGTIYEFVPSIILRWQNFPWNHYVTTTLAAAEGISYATKVPFQETVDADNDTKRLLNYLMFEATFAMPKYPQWELVARIHHRSGAFGLYGAGNSGSTAVGVGVRYLF